MGDGRGLCSGLGVSFGLEGGGSLGGFAGSLLLRLALGLFAGGLGLVQSGLGCLFLGLGLRLALGKLCLVGFQLVLEVVQAVHLVKVMALNGVEIGDGGQKVIEVLR